MLHNKYCLSGHEHQKRIDISLKVQTSVVINGNKYNVTWQRLSLHCLLVSLWHKLCFCCKCSKWTLSLPLLKQLHQSKKWPLAPNMSVSPSTRLKINLPEIVPPGLVLSMKAVRVNHGIIGGLSIGIYQNDPYYLDSIEHNVTPDLFQKVYWRKR